LGSRADEVVTSPSEAGSRYAVNPAGVAEW
jgi:hypothetical protein